MAYPGEHSLGHRYGHVSISEGAKAHLGDNYHVRADDPLSHLPYARDAPFNAYSRQHEHGCLPGTRVDLLHEIYEWADGQDGRRIFWLSGLAGTGKSTIARTVARSYYDKQCLAASFFFSRGGGDVSHAAKFVTSIAVQLAQNVPALRQDICNAITERSDIVSLSLRDQWQQLVCRPLSKLSTPGSYVVVIDALDECDNDNNIRIILQLLVEARSHTTQLRVLLTSRRKVSIRYQFKQMADGAHKNFVLHDISQSIIDHDIGLFVQDSLHRIAQERCLKDGWPDVEVVPQLVRSASGLFIWAETACRFIQEGKGRAPKRLKKILEEDTATSAAPEKHLNELYTTVLQNSIQNYTDEEKEEQSSAIRYVLGSIVVLFSPLSTKSLDELLSVPDGVRPILEDLHAILDIPNDHSVPLRLHHPSLRDFLFSRERCSDENFWVDEKSIHKMLASRCLELMSASGGLRQDICRLSNPGVLIDEIKDSMIMAHLSPELQYACRYWVNHLECSGSKIQDGDTAHRFLEKHFLHWLEVMSLIQETGLCVRLVARLQDLAARSHGTVTHFLHDAHRFVLRFVLVLEEAPLQIYSSALFFSPRASLVRNVFLEQVPRVVNMILGKGADEWDTCRSTLEGHLGTIYAVVFSPDGKMVASSSGDGTLRLWETATGQCYSVLVSRSGPIREVAFSPNGQLVASGSNDGTVSLWETATGYCCRVLEGHTDWVTKIVFSPDGQLVASASEDGTVGLWDTATGHRCKVLQCRFSKAIALVFSPDGQLITLASQDGSVWQWDTATDDYRRLLESHSSKVKTAAFSPDSHTVAFLLIDSTIQLWTIADQNCRVLKGHRDRVQKLFLSPDSQLVLLTPEFENSRLQLLNVADKSCRVLEGHSSRVLAAAFSPDGKLVASASLDRTLRIWEIEGHFSVSESSFGHVEKVIFSPNGQLVVSIHTHGTVRLWSTTGPGYTLLSEGSQNYIYTVAFSLDAKLVGSISFRGRVRIWDTTTGQCRWVSEEPLWGKNLEFLPDGRTLRTERDGITLPSHLWAASTISPATRPPLQTERVYSAQPDDKWIFCQNRRFLWLPPEYRTRVVAVYREMVCLGYHNGHVVVLRFDQLD